MQRFLTSLIDRNNFWQNIILLSSSLLVIAFFLSFLSNQLNSESSRFIDTSREFLNGSVQIIEEADSSAQEKSVAEEMYLDKHSTVKIYNGCGISGLAGELAIYLRDNGFDVIATENADNYDFAVSFITYLPGKWNTACQLLDILGISEQYAVETKNKFSTSDISVTIGADYSTLKPLISN